MVIVTLDELGHASLLDVAIRYRAMPGEPMVMYYPDGSGYPGSPPEAELLGVYVLVWEVGGKSRRRENGWVWEELDRIAREIIERDWEKYERICLEDASKHEEQCDDD